MGFCRNSIVVPPVVKFELGDLDPISIGLIGVVQIKSLVDLLLIGLSYFDVGGAIPTITEIINGLFTLIIAIPWCLSFIQSPRIAYPLLERVGRLSIMRAVRVSTQKSDFATSGFIDRTIPP